MLKSLVEGIGLDAQLQTALYSIHTQGPTDATIFEQLAYIKFFHPETFVHYEGKVLSAMGLFYKTEKPKSIFEEVYEIYSDSIEIESGRKFTPVQASAYKEIGKNRYFSFSAPTSAGKSYLFRELIKATAGDIIIVVPSRALIAEYYHEITGMVDSSILVLQFIEDINKEKTKRRIYIVTPERGVELFKYKDTFNISLFLLDEAQISEEHVRGMTFDSFVRRADRFFPNARKIFAHPFIENPEAQLQKHNFNKLASSKNYKLFTVGKIFLSFDDHSFEYFSPNVKCDNIKSEENIPLSILKQRGTLLVYISKARIYNGSYLENFQKYIELCPELTEPLALQTIEELREFIGASTKGSERHSVLIDMMGRGIVIHHGSMPLKARLLIERFIKSGFARICFATSTLSQGINMPFDVVWVDNFKNMEALVLKNLIGRSGRSTAKKGSLDYGFTVIKKSNVQTFKKRFNELVTLDPNSELDLPLEDIDEDLQDIVEAVRDETYDIELHLTDAQVERIKEANLDDVIKLILDELFSGETLITAKEYYNLSNPKRDVIKKALKNVFIQHLRRKKLSIAESSVLSAAIPMLLWHVQGKSFSEIVSLRYAFLGERDKTRKIRRLNRNGEITNEEMETQLDNVYIRYSQIPSAIPNKSLRSSGLYARETPTRELDYDLVVYDTYDYLDKVVGLSLVDPICAALVIYSEKTGDARAIALKNYIRFGTDDAIEIWLLRYGFGFEDIEWIKDYVSTVNEMRIQFKKTVRELPAEKLSVIERYL